MKRFSPDGCATEEGAARYIERYLAPEGRFVLHSDAQAEIARLTAERDTMAKALREGRRAIGEHHAPGDCYATGPLTGDAYRDLIECPACAFIARHDAILSRAKDMEAGNG